MSGQTSLPWPASVLGEQAQPRLSLLVLLVFSILAGLGVAIGEFNTLFVTLSLVACAFILFDFRIGVCLLIVLMPISASTLFPHSMAGITGFNPLNLLLLGTLLSSLVLRADGGSWWPRLPRLLVWGYVMPLIVAALIGMSHVEDIPLIFRAENLIGFDSAGSYLRDMLIRPLFMVIFALLVAAAMRRSPSLELFLFPMLLSVWFMGLMAIIFVYLSGASFGELASSGARTFFSPLGMHANDLGRCYAIAYALMLFTFAATENYRLRGILLASMGMVVVALILTFSRGAFLGFVVVNLLFLISRRKTMTLLFAGLVIIGMLFLLPGAVFDRITTGWEHGLNAISAGRINEIWLPLLPELWNSPLFGNGLGSILWSDPMRAGKILEVTHPHNAYLQAALDAGFVGLALLSAYFFHVWRGFRRLGNDLSLTPTRRGFYEGAAVGVLSFVITAFAGSSLMPVPEQTFLWLAIGMMYGEQVRNKNV